MNSRNFIKGFIVASCAAMTIPSNVAVAAADHQQEEAPWDDAAYAASVPWMKLSVEEDARFNALFSRLQAAQRAGDHAAMAKVKEEMLSQKRRACEIMQHTYRYKGNKDCPATPNTIGNITAPSVYAHEDSDSNPKVHEVPLGSTNSEWDARMYEEYKTQDNMYSIYTNRMNEAIRQHNYQDAAEDKVALASIFKLACASLQQMYSFAGTRNCPKVR